MTSQLGLKEELGLGLNSHILIVIHHASGSINRHQAINDVINDVINGVLHCESLYLAGAIGGH